jgi:hypothetical protein
MERNFGEWYRSVDVSPSAEKLKLRADVVDALSKNLKPEHSVDLVKIFFSLTPKSAEYKDGFVDAFFKPDPTFRLQKNDEEVRVLAGSLIATFLSESPNTLAGARLALLVTCTYAKGLGPAPAIPEVVSRCDRFLVEYSRLIRSTAGLKNLKAAVLPPKSDLDSLKTALAAANQLGTAADILNRVLEGALGAFRQDAAVLRSVHSAFSSQQDEIDLLWWLFGEHSNDLDKPWHSVGFPEACLVMGKEAADHVSLLPGPLSVRGILRKSLGAIQKDLGAKLSVSELVTKADKSWRSSWVSGREVGALGDLLPIRSAVQASVSLESGDWLKGHQRAAKDWRLKEAISCVDLMTQVYQESLVVKFFGS